jgi:predicted enzyme related to lactoylglutathione lyase
VLISTQFVNKEMTMAGDFVWYDVMTSDTEAALRFYGQVVGWTGQVFPGSEPPYTVLSAPGGGERGVGGIMPMPQGGRPMWNGYIHADDVDAAAKAVTAAGGTIQHGPWSVEGVGRMAVASDPQGAMFMLFRPQPPEGAAPPPLDSESLGVTGWRELMTTDWQGAFDFYSKVFGWTVDYDFDMGEMGTYRIFSTPGQPRAGGMMNKPAGNPAPTAWGYYFRVDGIDAAAERVKAAGGQVIMGPMEVPDGQFVLVGVDPQGAGFGLLSRTK